MNSLKLIFLMSTLAWAMTVSASQKKCEFENLSLADLTEENSLFKNNESEDKMVGLPKIFEAYKDQLGEFSAKDCKKSIRKTHFQSLESNKTYTFLYTNEDNCDGGNSYGLILSNKADSLNKDGVIAVITDSDISCL